MTDNLYQPPEADLQPVVSDAEAIRQEHIKTEASIKSVGVLLYLSSALMLLGGIGMFVVSLDEGFVGREELMLSPVLAAFILALALVYGFTAHSLRAFRRWARIVAIIIAVISLFNLPIGTLIGVYILYLMFSKKGKRLFEPDYPEIIAATPHIKYRTSILVWFFLALIIVAIAAAIIIPQL